MVKIDFFGLIGIDLQVQNIVNNNLWYYYIKTYQNWRLSKFQQVLPVSRDLGFYLNKRLSMRITPPEAAIR